MNSAQFVLVRHQLKTWIPEQTFPRPEDLVMGAVNNTRALYETLEYPNDYNAVVDTVNLWRNLQAELYLMRQVCKRKWYHIFHYPSSLQYAYDEFSKAIAICELQVHMNKVELDKVRKSM